MSDPRPWLGIVVALPALVAAMSYVHADVERLRRIAVISAAVMLAAAFIIAMSPLMHAFAVRTDALTAVAGGEAILRVDRTSDVLLPFAAALWLLTVAVAPRASLGRGGAGPDPHAHPPDRPAVPSPHRGPPPCASA